MPSTTKKKRGLTNIAGTRLGRANINFVQQSDHTGCSYPSVSNITVCEDSIQRKLKACLILVYKKDDEADTNNYIDRYRF